MIKIISGPSIEPVSYTEAKLQIGLPHDLDKALVEVMISAAREEAEGKTGRSLAPQTIMKMVDGFGRGEVTLPQGPVTSIESITYNDGEERTLPVEKYNLREALLCSVVPVDEWPRVAKVPNSVKITYEAGFPECPKSAKQWILIRVASLYANRENFVVGSQAMLEMPRSHSDCLLDSITIQEAP